MQNPINRLTQADADGFARTLKEMNLPHNSLRNIADEYQRLATRSAIYPGQGTPLGLMYVALKLNGEAGEAAEHVGKAMRDDKLYDAIEIDRENSIYNIEYFPLTPERRTAIIKEFGDMLWYISAGCNELGISMSEAMHANLCKLASRSERGKLSGSGDER